MADSIEIFKEFNPSNESYWRSINLFGKNVASYKFALAESLIKLAREGHTEVTLADLADPYSEAICRHIKEAPANFLMPVLTIIQELFHMMNLYQLLFPKALITL